MNTIGQVVKSITLGNNLNRLTEQLDLTDLTSGSYYIVLQSNEKVRVKMVVVD